MKTHTPSPIQLAVIGALAGIAIGTSLEVVASYAYGSPTYVAGVPQYLDSFSNQLWAVALERLIYAVLGAVIAMANILFGSEKLSLAKATFLHFIVVGASVLAAGAFLRWFPSDSLPAYIGFILITVVVYAIIWLIMWLSIRATIKKANKKLAQRHA